MAIDRPAISILGGGPIGLAAALALADIANIRLIEAAPAIPPRLRTDSPIDDQFLDQFGQRLVSHLDLLDASNHQVRGKGDRPSTIGTNVRPDDDQLLPLAVR